MVGTNSVGSASQNFVIGEVFRIERGLMIDRIYLEGVSLFCGGRFLPVDIGQCNFFGHDWCGQLI